MRVFERKGKRGSTLYIDYTYKGRRRIEAIGPDQMMAELAAKKREMEIFEGRFFPEKKKSRYKFKDLAGEFMEKHSRRNKRSWRRDEEGRDPESELGRFGLQQASNTGQADQDRPAP